MKTGHCCRHAVPGATCAATASGGSPWNPWGLTRAVALTLAEVSQLGTAAPIFSSFLLAPSVCGDPCLAIMRLEGQTAPCCCDL